MPSDIVDLAAGIWVFTGLFKSLHPSLEGETLLLNSGEQGIRGIDTRQIVSVLCSTGTMCDDFLIDRQKSN